MANPLHLDTAIRYCVDDLPGARLPGSRLQNVLERLRLGRSVTPLSLAFLNKQGLKALHRLATGTFCYDSFHTLALAEQAIRVQAAETEKRAREAARQAKVKRAQEQAEAARAAREKDPKYIAKMKNQKLRARYGIETYVEPHCFRQLMEIVKRVDAGRRLSEEHFVWLSSVGEEYFTAELQAAYHRLEADFFARQFNKTHDPWAAVNASSHYRKCDGADEANSILGTIRVGAQKSLKLKSALCTTHGGVMRDLERWNEALGLGEPAHGFMPNDYRPCTLLGAVHTAIGRYDLGQEWYAKAVERGASIDSVDQDLRNVFFRADQAKQREMSEFLLREDPIRFAWAKPRANAHKNRPQP